MATPVIMPKLGLAMAFGTLLHWLKAEGDTVRQGEVIAEIETEKATAEIEAPAGGRLGRLLVAPGTQVPVTTLLVHILAEGEAEPDDAGGRVRLSPAARKAARDLGLDDAEIARAFPAGRVTREEVEAWAANRAKTAAAAVAVVAPEPARRPLTVMRRAIAHRMLESLQGSAQLTLTAEVDVSALVQFREAHAPAFEQEHGFRPTYTDFLVMAMARAVPTVPQINARWGPEAIELLPEVHVGVAVALDDGLIVPVIRSAESLRLVAIGRQVRDLAQRAREGRLIPGEASGSTITLTNLGPEGIDAFTPVLNAPEVAILGAGRVREIPVLVDGQLAVRSVMTLSLTIDHRVVDGAPGARYLRRVAALLAQPVLLLAG